MKTRIAVAAIALFPLGWIFNIGHWSLPGDAGSIAWSVGYGGEYLRRHGVFPVVLNTNAYVGMAFPIYYGFIFQPLAALASVPLGGDLALRLVVVGSFVFEQFQVYATVLRIAGRSSIALAVTALTAFEIYPLTDFYQRGAIAEFVALAWLVSATCLWFRFLREPDPIERRRNLVWAALCFTLAAGTHPVYAVYGALFAVAGALVALWMRAERRAVLLELALAALAIASVLAPWLYLVRFYPPTIVSIEPPIFVPGIDHALFRLAPLPFDARLLVASAAQLSTPHLDTQISIPLLIVVLTLAIGFSVGQRSASGKVRLELAFAACCFAGAAALYILSVNARLMALAPFFLWSVQYVYRLVGFIDVLLFAAVCFLLLAFSRARAELPLIAHRAIWFAVAIAFVSAGMKLAESAGSSDYKVPGTALFDDRSKLIDYPGVATSNYASNQGFRDELPVDVGARIEASFPVGSGANFGQPEPVKVTLDGTRISAVTADAIAFPWGRLAVDGRLLRPGEIFAVDAPLRNNVELLEAIVARTSLTVGFAVVPDPLWSALRTLSLATLFAWIAVGIVLALLPRLISRRRP